MELRYILFPDRIICDFIKTYWRLKKTGFEDELFSKSNSDKCRKTKDEFDCILRALKNAYLYSNVITL